MAYHDEIHPLHHTIVNYPSEDPPGTTVRVIFTIDGPFPPLLEYFKAGINRKKSKSWQRQVARAVGYLYDFMIQVGHCYQGENRAQQVLSDFALALSAGTIGFDGNDSRGLFWPQLSWQSISSIITSIDLFNKWCHEIYGAKRIVNQEKATLGEQIARYHALDHKNKKSFFRHTRNLKLAWTEAATKNRPDFVTKLIVSARAPRFYRPDKFEELLYKGYLLPGVKNTRGINESNVHKYFNTRDQMIAILQGAGGLRESEPFHLYVDDVTEDLDNPGHALVKVRHPSEGLVTYKDPLTGKEITTKRSNYLRTLGLVPRDIASGNFEAGWKDLMVETDKSGDYFVRVYFFPTYWGEIFLKLYKNYIFHARPRGIATPFLYVSMDSKHYGEPYSVQAYSKNHNAATARIGIEPKESEGTTTHGLRHLYGHNLTEGGVSTVLIQECLHQKSIMSQNPYTLPTVKSINEALQKAQTIKDTLKIASSGVKAPSVLF